MAKRPKCFSDIRRVISPERVDDKTLVDVIRAHEESLRKPVDMSSQEFAEKLKESRKLRARLRKEAAENLVKKQKNIGFLFEGALSDDPVEAFQALLAGTTRLVKGGRFSIDRTHKVIMAKHLNILSNELRAAGLLDVVKSGTLEREIMQELFEFKSGGRTGISNNKHAREAAKIINGVQTGLLREMQNSGAGIREMPGYIMRQAHDPGLMRDAGFEAWFQEIMPRLDVERTFKSFAGKPDKIQEFMEGAYDDIVKGKNTLATGSDVGDEILLGRAPANLAEKVSRGRVLHFKDGESFFEYNQRFGKKNLFDTITSSVDTTARNAALIRVLGTNPKNAFENLLKSAKDRLKEAGDDAGFDRFVSNEKKIRQLFSEVEGLTRIPGRSLFAKTSRAARALANMAKLGSAAVSSVTDWPNSASILRASTGKNLLQAHGDLFKNYMGLIKRGDKQKWATRTRIFIDDTLGDLHSKFSSGDPEVGVMSKLERLFFKLNGLAFQTSHAKTAVARQFAMELADLSSQQFPSLTPRVQANLQVFGIGDMEWALIRRASEVFEDGTKALTPEGVANLKDSEVNEFLKAVGSKKSVAEVKSELELKLSSYLSDNADLGSPTPGARERNFIIRGTTEDEPIGQLLRMIGQFKSFPLTMHTVFTRVALADPQRTARNLTEVMRTGQGDLLGLAGLIGSTTAMGYVAISANEVAKGRTPRDPTDPKIWLESFIRSGSAGLYGDFLLGEYQKNYKSIIKDVAGPTLGQADDIASLWASAIRGEPKAGKAFKLLLNNTPGQNIFYTRTALDYLVLFKIQEALNPGYLARLERRTRENPGLLDNTQEFFLPRPTSRR